jgi:pyruvate/2-oxoglutarate dehydrogenase complex dihydrolipoamide acyltransferase (E2) component
VGRVIALLAEEGDDISNLEAPKEEASAPLQSTSSDSSFSSQKPESDRVHSNSTHEPPSHGHVSLEHSRPLFPSVHRLLLEHNVTNLEKIKGTGVRGMLTKGDVLTFVGKASNPLGTFKFSPSPIEEASKLVEKKKDVVQVRHYM